MHKLPKDKWRAEYHGHGEESNEEIEAPKEAEHAKLKPKEPMADDPRLVIPQGKSTAAHDHPIMSKEPVPSEEHSPRYGEAYEHQRKEALHGSKESAGLAPKLPVGDPVSPAPHYKEPKKLSRKPCSAYGEINRCEGMSCEADEDCASQCCG